MEIYLTENQKKVLYLYSLYSNNKDMVYLQYTGILALSFYLMNNKVFPEYRDSILVYDYLDARRYVWEDKIFMNDINVLRGYDLLMRARVRTLNYRDVNSHQITKKGADYLESILFQETLDAREIDSLIYCPRCKRNPRLLDILIEEKNPVLKCSCNYKREIEGFLKDITMEPGKDFVPFFL
jgi:hypothetical protein